MKLDHFHIKIHKTSLIQTITISHKTRPYLHEHKNPTIKHDPAAIIN